MKIQMHTKSARVSVSMGMSQHLRRQFSLGLVCLVKDSFGRLGCERVVCYCLGFRVYGSFGVLARKCFLVAARDFFLDFGCG